MQGLPQERTGGLERFPECRSGIERCVDLQKLRHPESGYLWAFYARMNLGGDAFVAAVVRRWIGPIHALTRAATRGSPISADSVSVAADVSRWCLRSTVSRRRLRRQVHEELVEGSSVQGVLAVKTPLLSPTILPHCPILGKLILRQAQDDRRLFNDSAQPLSAATVFINTL